jgi:hypothetical protein
MSATTTTTPTANRTAWYSRGICLIVVIGYLALSEIGKLALGRFAHEPRP